MVNLERETESLNKARELVLRNDSFPPHQGLPSLRYFTFYFLKQGLTHFTFDLTINIIVINNLI